MVKHDTRLFLPLIKEPESTLVKQSASAEIALKLIMTKLDEVNEKLEILIKRNKLD